MSLTEVHPSGKRRVLVVDDDPVIRTFCKKILKQAGYTTLAAAGSADAIWLIESSAEPFDLLVVDVFLPISPTIPLVSIQHIYPPMNGDEMVRHMLATVPELRVLYISSSSHDNLLKQGIVLSPAPFVQKPLTADTLLRSVKATIEAPPLRLDHLEKAPPKSESHPGQQFWLAS